ncbi:MAG: helix-turn-helix transcriptional regulator [Clostridia bacterium]|nr:helix-turn-helix transcriptional regulator [Clostridia bacterium]
MKGSKRLGYNLLGLLRAFNETQGNLALTLGISTSYLSEIVNGKKEPERPQLEKLAKHFGMSPESLLNDDFASIRQITDFGKFTPTLAKLFPLFASEASLSNPDFSEALAAQKKLYKAEEDGIPLSESEADNLFNTVFDRYSEIEDELIGEEVAANTLSFIFYMLVCGRATEMLARYKNHEESYPILMSKFLENKPKTKERIDEILESDKPIEDNAFKNMVNDPEFDEAINEIFEGLRETDEWNDLIDYYIALEYIFGAVDNVFSMEQNHDFGVDLMLKYAAIGNTFALSYVSSMIIS